MEVCLCGDARDPEIKSAVESVYRRLKERGIQLYSHETTDFLPEEAVGEKFEGIYIIVGNDRTFLRVLGSISHEVSALLLSVGEGSFLSDLSVRNFADVIPRLLGGEYSIEKRVRICTDASPPALNEIAVFPRRSATLMRYSLRINDELIYRTSADGVVVSTPTGSTGYSLSLGGPIVMHNADVFVVTPVAPMSRKVKPVVVPISSMVEICDIASDFSVEIVVDGYFRRRVGDSIHIVRAENVNLVRLDEKPLIQKLDEVERSHVYSLPPSAKYVFKILEYRGAMTQKEIIAESMLPERTVRHALSVLLKAGLITKKVSIRDPRQDIYRAVRNNDEKSSSAQIA